MIWTDSNRIVSIEGTKNMSIKEHANRIIQNDIGSGSHGSITSDLKKSYSIYLGNERKLSNFVSTAISHMFMMENLLDSENKESLKFLLTYPLFDQDTFESRIKELLSLDINGIFSFGKVQLKKICILGKGSVGLVTLARFKGKYFALKIRRTDANRMNMFDEVVYQSLANSIGIGPFLVNFSDNFMLMEFVKGSNIVDWYNSYGLQMKEY